MKIVVLDGYTENPGDLSWSALEQLGETLAEYRKVFFAQVQPDLAVGEYERDGQRYYMIFNFSKIISNTSNYCIIRFCSS